MSSMDELAGWWNGRHWGLKIPCSLGRAGSTPASAIVKMVFTKNFQYGIKDNSNAISV
jgi:hypothetical protein